MRPRPLITIDGPAGVGKSTVSRELARRLSYLYLDTGALYRAVAWAILKARVNPAETAALERFLRGISISLGKGEAGLGVFVDGYEVSWELRTEEVGMTASVISAYPTVREALLDIQRDFAKEGGVVAEGRDMGTVVFPDAEIKFFLDADLDERIRRRYEELRQRGEEADYEALREAMVKRDRQDRERPIAPLRPPADAVVVDATVLDAAGVVSLMMGVVEAYLVSKGKKDANLAVIGAE
ncbi:MAG TPA: (d)CMP kinase [Syntrophales bacterium]|nr:(d)CMP kinase [Syntrophales bacterium]HOM07193.1 (d)CMP kinase [Syntrophales bacterium]HOO00235.1 (d)CMP kinase [Syntrophales bacterium]HPQ06728.1 (d)CMP kinase [Syntrophales bacterium]HRS87228.1 (d)CMP kinase [Syntrophales bacterium]